MRLTRMSAVTLTAMAMVAAPASAKTITLHYFMKQGRVRLTDASGHAVNRHIRPVAGFKGDEIGLAYAGNSNRHAKRWTASFHLRCVFRSSKRATCDAQFAIGGSMLLLNRVTVNFQTNSERLTINGGTGVFSRAHGTMRTVTVHGTNSADVTIRVRL